MAHSPILDDNVETPNSVGTELQVTTQNNKVATQPYTNPNTNNNYTQKVNQSAMYKNQAQNSNTQDNTTNNVVQNVQTPNTNISIQRPSDYSDNTVQGYLNDYQYGVDTNNYQLQINSLTAIDKYRTSKGLEPIYTDNIYALMNEREQKINKQIKAYEDEMAYANENGDYDTLQAIGNELDAYKKSVNYAGKPNNSATYIADREEYKSQYNNVIDGIVNELLTMRFTYNPSEDETFLRAQEYATNTAMEKMNARGVLDSTMTAQIVASTVANLQTEYMKMAKDDFYKNVDRLKAMANFVIDLDDRSYKRWQEQTSRSLEYYTALKNEASYQWNRVDALGYVDNEASIVLGVPVGTLSASVRKSISDAQAKAESQYNEAMTSLMVAQAKEELSRETYAYKQALDTQTYANKKAIDYQYKTANNTVKNEIGVYKPVDSNSLFTGSLKPKALIDAISGMSAEEAIPYARENANSRDTWVQALNALDMTEKEANDILTSNAVEQTMSYVDSMLQQGNITQEEWQNWYDSNGLDWRTKIYQGIRTQIGNQSYAEAGARILKEYMNQGLDDAIAEQLYNDIQSAYNLTDEQMLKLLE